MKWTTQDMLMMDSAGKRCLNPHAYGDEPFFVCDTIAAAFPAYFRYEYQGYAPEVTADAGRFISDMHKMLERLPEWLRGGVPSTEEKKFMNRVNAAARRNIARRKAAGSSLKSSQTVSGRR